MRVLMASDHWLPERRGGAARVAGDLASGLARRGHDVVVIAPQAPGAPAHAEALELERALPRGWLPQTLVDAPATRRAARRLGRRFDVLVAHQSTTALGLASALPEVPLAVVYHASAAREAAFVAASGSAPLARRAASGLLAPLLRALERAALARADHILALSEFTRSLLREDHPATAPRVDVLPGAVDTAVFEPADGPQGARARLGLPVAVTLLVTARRLEPRMGVDGLLRALALGAAEVQLAVVGDGSAAPGLRRLAHALRLDDRVRFAGAVDDATLRDWYRAADLFVLPTLAYEGFGIATAEALACGTPVVGTPVGATAELLGPLASELVAESAAPGAIAAAVERALALTGPALRARCRSFALERLSWDSALGSWEEALQSTAAARTRATALAGGAEALEVGGSP